MRDLRVLLVALLLGAPAYAGQVISENGVLRFEERFPWLGDHAATTAGEGTTTWWDANSWDVRGDTTFLAIAGLGKGFHVDIHRAASGDPADGRIVDGVAVGGDGTPGVGIMHVDFQGINSARLRNPMLISASRPAVISFWAPRFLTGAHWWEIAITPAQRVVGGEYTSVPTVEDGFTDPLVNGTVGTPGPGHRPAEDSINFIATGYPDTPCQPDLGFRVRFGVTKTVGGARQDFVNRRSDIQKLQSTDPKERDDLYQFRLEYSPDRIAFYGDFDRDGKPELLETFNVTIPWSEVYVHLLAVAYEADHHPQEPCYQGQIRELQWRNVRVEPVKYGATAAVPKEQGIRNVQRDTGWLSFDIRDTQRFGPPVNGVPQPNVEAYDRFSSLVACSGSTFFCPSPVTRVSLSFALPQQTATIARAQFTYDIKNLVGPGTATLTINGQPLGVLPNAASVPAAQGEEWVHRAVDVDPKLLRATANDVRIDLSGFVQLDRMQMEFAYAPQTIVPRRHSVRR